MNATSLDDVDQKLTSQLIYARRNVIFSGEFSRNLRPENIKIKFFASEFKDEVSFSVTFDKGTTFDASGNLSSQDTSFNIRIVGIPIPVAPKKTPITLKQESFVNDQFLNATSVADAETKFSAQFIFEHKNDIFTGTIIEGFAQTDISVKKDTTITAGAGEYAFVITIAAGKSYDQDGNVTTKATELKGKITNIPVAPKKTPITLKQESFVNDQFLNATSVADAETKFSAQFIFEHKNDIFTGTIIEGFAQTDISVKKDTTITAGAGEYAFVITIAAGKSYDQDGNVTTKATELKGKITNIPTTSEFSPKSSQGKNQESKLFSLDSVKKFINKLINKK